MYPAHCQKILFLSRPCLTPVVIFTYECTDNVITHVGITTSKRDEGVEDFHKLYKTVLIIPMVAFRHDA